MDFTFSPYKTVDVRESRGESGEVSGFPEQGADLWEVRGASGEVWEVFIEPLDCCDL